MGSELLRIAEGFSIVAEGLRGLAKAEGGTKTAEKETRKTQKAQPSVSEKAQQEQPATLEGIPYRPSYRNRTRRPSRK